MEEDPEEDPLPDPEQPQDEGCDGPNQGMEGGQCVLQQQTAESCAEQGFQGPSESGYCYGPGPDCPEGAEHECDADFGVDRERHCESVYEFASDDGCRIKHPEEDERSEGCPEGMGFYSQVGCADPCPGQILVDGACHSVGGTPPDETFPPPPPGTPPPPPPPPSCPIGYDGTPPNCTAGTPEIYVLATAVPEGDGTVSVTVALSHAGTGAATVDVATADGTALAGSDYTTTSVSVSIAAGSRTATVSVPILDDSTYEPDEAFTMVLSNVAGDAEFGASTSADVTITDDDLPSVPLPQATISDITVAENAATADFTVTLDKAWTFDVSVVADTRDGTATAGSDYTALSGETVTISAGATSATVSVDLTDDVTDEPDETFDIVLSSPSSATLGSPSSATATITDNDDLPVVSVSDVAFDEDYSIVLNPPIDINGDGTLDDEYLYSLDVDFDVELDNPSARQVTVTVSTADGTATGTSGWCPAYAPANTGSIDFRSTSQAFTFAPGETSKTFTVVVCPDAAGEGIETFSVELSSAVNATVGDAGAGRIRDNDAASVNIDSSVSADEGSALDFTVSLSKIVPHDVTVTVSTGDDPAATHPADATGAHRDYTPLAGHTVTIAAGFQTATVSVDTVSDTIDEFDETFVLRIDNVTSATVAVVGSTDTAVGTITDDDTSPEVSIGDVSAGESDGSLSFEVSLSHPSQQTITVTAATSASSPVSAAGAATCTATDGSQDYETASSTVTFAPNATTATFTVTLCADTAPEPDEKFTVTLSSPVNATVSPAAGAAEGTIRDDDACRASEHLVGGVCVPREFLR